MGRGSFVLAAVGLLLLGASWLPSAGGLGSSGEQVAPPARESALAERGRILFTVKGCVVCHRHGEVSVQQSYDLNGVGPELTTYTAEAGYLRAWLSDPTSIRPRTQMPDLDLGEQEIDALVSFLNHGAHAVPSGEE